MSKYKDLKGIADSDDYPFTYSQMRHFVYNRKTNGLIDAVVKIGRRIYINIDMFEEWIESHTEVDQVNANLYPMLASTLITEIAFSTRTRNVLNKLNIITLADLTKITKAQLNDIKGSGVKVLEEIESILNSYGFKLS